MKSLHVLLLILIFSAPLLAEPSPRLTFGHVRDLDGAVLSVRWDSAAARYLLSIENGKWDGDKEANVSAPPMGYRLDRTTLEAFAAEYKKAKYVAMALKGNSSTNQKDWEDKENPAKLRRLNLMTGSGGEGKLRVVAITIDDGLLGNDSRQFLVPVWWPSHDKKAKLLAAGKTDFEKVLSKALAHTP